MNKTVLIIEDSSYMRDILSKALKHYEEMDIKEAKDGEEGISKFEEVEPDIILLDLNLPGMKGDELLEEISGSDNKSEVLIVTGVPQDELLERCLDLGAQDYIVKPFELDELREKVEELI